VNQYFDPTLRQLIFIDTRADPLFWDQHWRRYNIQKLYAQNSSFDLVVKYTKKFLPRGSRILEGGCGRGQNVYKLLKKGFNAQGIDYASQTIKRVKKHFPQLNIQVGDLRHLEIPNGYFDGYWSIGVIEHFYAGYERIIDEMARVLRKDGFLFLSFPYMSPLRKIKARLNFYPLWKENPDLQKDFYQFALDADQVKKDIEKRGLTLIAQHYLDGTKGLKDECGIIKPVLQKLYDSQNSAMKGANFLLSLLFSRIAAHSLLCIFQKTF